MDLLAVESVAAVVTIATGVVAGAFGLRRLAAARGADREPDPLDFELVPIRFEANVSSGAVPHVVVVLRVVNYRRKSLTLVEARVRYLQLAMIGNIDDIRAQDEYVVSPHSSREVYCRRKLHEVEAARIVSAGQEVSRSCSATISGRARVGGKEYRYEPINALQVVGRIEGLPVAPPPPK